MRIIDYLRDRTEEVARRLRSLRINGYESDDLGAAARNVAAVWERCLKASERTWSARKTSLHDMTEELATRGWRGAAALHTVRGAANADKHDASPDHDMDQILAAVERLADAVQSLPTYLARVTDELPERLRRRRMVCAVYDHFAHGETEYVFLAAEPNDTWRTAREVDRFQVRSKSSSTIEAALGALDGWVINPPEFGPLRDSLEESDSELLHIGVFTASYQDVLDLLTSYQHDLPLLPGLHREDATGHVVATIVASVIAGRTDSGLTARSQENAEWATKRITQLLSGITGHVGGLRVDRCDASTFAQVAPDALAADSELGVVVTRDGVVLILE